MKDEELDGSVDRSIDVSSLRDNTIMGCNQSSKNLQLDKKDNKLSNRFVTDCC